MLYLKQMLKYLCARKKINKMNATFTSYFTPLKTYCRAFTICPWGL